mgnify:CR=1 FL=1
MCATVRDGEPWSRRIPDALRLCRARHVAGVNAGDLHPAGHAVVLGGDFHFITRDVADESLRRLGEVGDDVLVHVAIPGAEDGLGVFRAVVQVLDIDNGADAGLVRRCICKVGATGVAQLALVLGLHPEKHGLLLLGGFVLEVFAQVAVLAGDLDVLLVLRDLDVDDVLELLLFLFEGVPRDDEGFILARGGAFFHESLHFGPRLDDPGHEGAAGQLIEDIAGEQALGKEAHLVLIRICHELAEEFAIG